MTPNLPLHRMSRITTSTLLKTGSAVLYGVSASEAVGNDVSVEFYSTADGSGTPVFTATITYGNYLPFDLTPFGGIAFATHLYAKIVPTAETTPVIHVWYD